MNISKTNQEKIINYIQKTLSDGHFTWKTDIMERTIWGFKNAPYKSFSRAKDAVSKILDELLETGVLVVDGDAPEGYQVTYSKGPQFNLIQPITLP